MYIRLRIILESLIAIGENQLALFRLGQLTFLIITYSWIIEYLFKFDKTIWYKLLIIQVLFRISVSQQPRKLKKRIIFLCFLALSFYYSCNFLASMTDFNYVETKVEQINTLKDFIDSRIFVGFHVIIPNWIDGSNDEDLARMWAKKNVQFEGTTL